MIGRRLDANCSDRRRLAIQLTWRVCRRQPDAGRFARLSRPCLLSAPLLLVDHPKDLLAQLLIILDKLQSDFLKNGELVEQVDQLFDVGRGPLLTTMGERRGAG